MKFADEAIKSRALRRGANEIAERQEISLNVRCVIQVRTISLVVFVLVFGACTVTEQTPNEVGQKFEEGIKGKGKIVPIDQEGSQTEPSTNLPATQPAGSSQ